MTSARISWTLPPEELSDAAYIPSLWTVQKMTLLILLSIVLGPLSLVDFIAAGPTVHPNWPTHRESGSHTSDIRFVAYFSAYGGGPSLPLN
jgi:hypothetical protein